MDDPALKFWAEDTREEIPRQFAAYLMARAAYLGRDPGEAIKQYRVRPERFQ